jgi:hypothetical protein
MSRKQRRKAKPLGRVGVPIHSSVAGIKATDGSTKFYWFATEDYEHFLAVLNMEPAELMKVELHGPFDTADEADAAAAARIAISGEHCEFRHGGMWDPAWSKPQ